nr:PilW family protein [Moraxella sp. CTOTU48841]
MQKNQYIASIQPKQHGFTLVELMISLVLGLLVSAAAIQIYMVSVRTGTTQAGAADLQDVSIFGIQGLEKELRIANLGSTTTLNTTTPGISNNTPDAGIVLSQANVMGVSATTFGDNLLTRTGNADNPATTGNGWKAVSGTNQQSDQLTIQYTNITGSDQVDCESFTVSIDAKVIERYFLKAVTDSNSNVIGYSLRCDAGRVDPARTGILAAAPASGDTPAIPGFGDAGQEVMTNIDQFKVLLGVQSPAGQLSYLSPAIYNSLATTSPIYRAPIVAVKVGIIARSAKPIVASNIPTNFSLFGVNNVVASNTSYLRRTYESTTMLRNAQVVKIP